MNRKSVYQLMNALGGIATCATQCPCCRTHAEIAQKALKKFERRTQISAEDARLGSEGAIGPFVAHANVDNS